MKTMLTAAQAAQLLGVSPATLYSYVSRGLLVSHGEASARSKRYAHDDVQRLAARRKDGRQAGHAVEQAIDWGKPILESAITHIAETTFRYRGHDALKLAATHTLEQVAAILWDEADVNFFSAPISLMPAASWEVLRQPWSALMPLERAAILLPAFAALLQEAHAPREQTAALFPYGAQLMRALAAALLDRPLSAAPLHHQLGAAWSLDDAAMEMVRSALVLCADHELNVSTFTVRCVASTGARLDAALVAGLAALSGPMHGGELPRVRRCLDAALAADARPDTLRAALEHSMRAEALDPGFSKGLPGFGHPLYPGGDPRGALLLELLAARAAAHPLSARVLRIAQLATELTGQHPNIDVGLASLECVFELPAGAAQAIFALGRSAGWIAHAAEQTATGRLIRPRARYVGAFPPSD